MKNKEPKTHTVNITVDGKGKFFYDQAVIIVERKDNVIWKCQENPTFAVHVGWNSPLDKGRYSTSTKEIRAQVREDAQNNRYKYFVAVLVGKEIWTDDPEIIIKPPTP